MESNDKDSARPPLLPYAIALDDDADGKDDEVDGLSLYRALARQHAGDPSKYVSVMNGVLDLYLRMWAHPNHPDSKRIRDLDGLEYGRLKTFFNALACPDAIEPDRYGEVVGFIADALNIRIGTWTRGPGAGASPISVSEHGRPRFPIYHVLRSQRAHPGPESSAEQIFRFDSLLEDESGTALMDFLESQKNAMDREKRGETQTTVYNGLQLKKLCWWWQTTENRDAFDQRLDGAYESVDSNGFTMRWFNEHVENAPQAPRLDDVRDSLAVFTVSITTPDEILPALRLLSEALKRAPAQEIPVNPRRPIGAGGKRSLRRYVGIDAEFVQKRGEIGDAQGDRSELEAGNPELLCSVLTVAVDRHLIFSFYLLHMLENPTVQTVPQLCMLFEELLFGPRYLKVWWNYGEDFAVLDATIAHMFQGTPRKRYLKTIWRSPSRWIQPFFKVKSIHYGGERPPNLTFSSDPVQCHFHQLARNDLGMACPCGLGNVDLSTILDDICRQLGLAIGIYDSSSLGPRSWFVAKTYNNYAKLLGWLLGQDRLFPLLDYLKDGARRSGNKDDFYQSLGPGMETDIDKMGYNIGDVVGVALIMRYLTTTDDRLPLAARLLSYARMQPRHPETTVPQRLVQPRTSSLEFPQIEDNPRLWRRDRLSPEMGIAGNYETCAINTAWHTYVRHEEVADCARERFEQARGGGSIEECRLTAMRSAYLDVFDPTEYALPEQIFTLEMPTDHEDCANKRAIVRTGKAHDDDLIDFIRSRLSRKTLPPRGFLAPRGTALALPSEYNRLAGQSLRNSGPIGTAFELHYNLPRGQTLWRRDDVQSFYNQPRPTIVGNNDSEVPSWDRVRAEWEIAQRQAEADRVDTERGLPAEYRPDLVFDPDGRQHNLNIMAPDSLASQFYSPCDIARPQNPRVPKNILTRLRMLLNPNRFKGGENDEGPGQRRGRLAEDEGGSEVSTDEYLKQAAGGIEGSHRERGESQRGRGEGNQSQDEGSQGQDEGNGVHGKIDPRRRRGPNRGRSSAPGQSRGHDPRVAIPDLARRFKKSRLQNALAAWEKPTLGKRVRFDDVEDGKQEVSEGHSRIRKSVRVY